MRISRRYLVVLLFLFVLCMLPVCAHAAVGDEFTVHSTDAVPVPVLYKVLTEPEGENPGTVQVVAADIQQGTTALTLPDNLTYDRKTYDVTVIGSSAFQDRSMLTTIHLPSGLRAIGEEAFSGCRCWLLSTLPAGITSIGQCAFSGCTSLALTELPEGITSIEDNAFEGCTSLVLTELPTGLISIGKSAFSQCRNLSLMKLPSGITSIGNNAFEGCTNLTLTELPGGLTSIGDYAFEGCTSLAPTKFPSGLTSIGDYAFEDCASLTLTELPSGITSIGSGVFANCSKLALTELSAGITSIGQGAFYNCSNLALTELPAGITSIGRVAFAYCSNLALTELPAGIVSIGQGTFIDCTKLALTELPSGLTSIEDITFYGCTNLVLTELPAGLTSIGQGAFYHCTKLALNELPAGITSIGLGSLYEKYGVFEGCTSLALTALPPSLVQIGGEAFRNCTGIKTLTCTNMKAPTLGREAFTGCNCVTYIPQGATGYTAEKGWRNVQYIEDSPIVTSLHFWQTNYSLRMGEQIRLTPTIKPDDVSMQLLQWTSTDPTVATVSKSGLVTGIAAGTATITVTAQDAGAQSASCTITVAQISSIHAVFYQGATVVFDRDKTNVLRPMLSVEAYYNNGDTLTIPGTDPAVILGGLLRKGTSRMTATYMGKTDEFFVLVTETPVPPDGIRMSDMSVLQRGETTRLSVEYSPANTTERALTWTSDNEIVATVDQNGVVRALTAGTATITATSAADAEVSASCVITVEEATAPADLDAPIDKLTLGKGKSLDVAALYGGAYQWTSSDPSVATVTEDGVIKGKGTGTATITGTLGGLQSKSALIGDEVHIDVVVIAKNRAVTKVKLSPKALSLDIGESQSLSANLSPANPDDSSVTWRTSDASVVIVDDTGIVTGMSAGEATITAIASSGVKDTAKVTVSDFGSPVPVAATGIVISPNARTQKIGEAVKLDVLIQPTGATAGAILWTSGDLGIATVDANGVVTAIAQGETIVTATMGALPPATCAVKVVEADAAEKALTLTVDYLAIAKGKSFKLNNLTGFKGKWAIDDPDIATVSDKGVLKAKRVGDAILTFTVGKVTSKHAKFMGKSLVAGDSVAIQLYVVGKGKAVTQLSLKSATVIAPGEDAPITATTSPKVPAYGQVFWHSADPSIAAVNKLGVITGMNPGKTTITGTASSGISKSIKVTVTEQIQKLTINKTKATVKRGRTYQLEARVLPAGLPIPALTWTSSKESVAVVDATGLVTAIKKGKTTIAGLDPISGLKVKCTVTVK